MHLELLSCGQRAEAQIEESRMLLLGEGISGEGSARSSSYTLPLLDSKAMIEALPPLCQEPTCSPNNTSREACSRAFEKLQDRSKLDLGPEV
jgi:hypothetical protein